MVRKSKEYSPSPILWPLAEYYIHPDAYGYWEGDPFEFKQMIKNHLISHISQSVEPYVKSIPFLRISFPENMYRKQKHVMKFDEDLKGFLKTRKIVRVTIWNIKDFKGDLIPLDSKEIISRTGQTFDGGGFEIGLGYQLIQSALTTFSHEIGHTYFYDLSKNPPRCLIPNNILEITKWYAEFEGIAFDLGREILLPRKRFRKFVLNRYKDPSLEGFLKMNSELKVSKDVLSQRLLKDLKIWEAYIFWGKIDSSNLNILGKGSWGPHIFVRDRDKRKSDIFTFNLKKELLDRDSDLRRIIVENSEEGKVQGGEVDIGERSYKFDMKSSEFSKGEKWFIALLHQ